MIGSTGKAIFRISTRKSVEGNIVEPSAWHSLELPPCQEALMQRKLRGCNLKPVHLLVAEEVTLRQVQAVEVATAEEVTAVVAVAEVVVAVTNQNSVKIRGICLLVLIY